MTVMEEKVPRTFFFILQDGAMTFAREIFTTVTLFEKKNAFDCSSDQGVGHSAISKAFFAQKTKNQKRAFGPIHVQILSILEPKLTRSRFGASVVFSNAGDSWHVRDLCWEVLSPICVPHRLRYIVYCPERKGLTRGSSNPQMEISKLTSISPLRIEGNPKRCLCARRKNNALFLIVGNEHMKYKCSDYFSRRKRFSPFHGWRTWFHLAIQFEENLNVSKESFLEGTFWKKM